MQPKKYHQSRQSTPIQNGLADALQSASLYGLSTHRGAREHALKMIVTITSGTPKSDTLKKAFDLRYINNGGSWSLFTGF